MRVRFFSMDRWGGRDIFSDGLARMGVGRVWRVVVPMAAFIALAVMVVIFARGRTYFGEDTELDFIYRFAPEAKRVMHGSALLVAFHPPLYPFFLAAVKCFVSSWMTAGLIVSGIAGVAAAWASFYFFDRLVGRAAAWGAMVGLGSSVYFLSSAVMTTNDMFFFACYAGAWLACVVAFLKRGAPLWVVAGLATGCAILARTNGIVLAPLMLLPLLQPLATSRRLRGLGAMALGAAIVVGAWVGYAVVTGSPLAPRAGTVDNLTLTYFPPGHTQFARISGDSMQQVQGRFHSVWQLLAYDPGHIVKQYAIDLAHMVAANLTELIWWPIAWLGIPGIYLLIRHAASRRFAWYFLLITLCHMLMINMKAYEPRYYMFVIPVLGAGAGLTAEWLWRNALLPRGMRVAAVACFALLAAYGVHREVTATPYELHPWTEMQTAQIVPRLSEEPSNAILVARTPAVAVSAGLTWKYFPLVSTYRGLHTHLQDLSEAHPGRPIFLQYAFMEHGTRPAFGALRDRDESIPWLKPVAHGVAREPWTIYRFVPGGDGRYLAARAGGPQAPKH